ncbi:hypothetical protein C8Q80DRAFT_915214 [Daedaleopsis nitida]|nr:hypothetical protein C8Q80DRAFT_915214 [Daedaleopsis nitida]
MTFKVLTHSLALAGYLHRSFSCIPPSMASYNDRSAPFTSAQGTFVVPTLAGSTFARAFAHHLHSIALAMTTLCAQITGVAHDAVVQSTIDAAEPPSTLAQTV